MSTGSGKSQPAGRHSSLRLWEVRLEQDAGCDARLGLSRQPAGLFGVRSCSNTARPRFRLLLADLWDINIIACLVLPLCTWRVNNAPRETEVPPDDPSPFLGVAGMGEEVHSCRVRPACKGFGLGVTLASERIKTSGKAIRGWGKHRACNEVGGP